MNQDAAYSAFEGKEVDGYVIRVSKITEEQGDTYRIEGEMTDPSVRKRPGVPFVVCVIKSDLDTPREIEELIFEMGDQIDQRRSTVWINRT